MKKTITMLTFLLATSMALFAKSKTIEYPAYEFKKSGIYNLTKIELTDSATFLTIHSTFIPHWWVEFNDYEVIRDSDTGQEFKITGIEGAVMNEHLWMPDSGDSTVVLIFPPLPLTVKRIDYQENIFGISLDASNAAKRGASIVSPEIEKWLGAELSKASKKTLDDFESSDFFNDSPARLIGCIKGYDERVGFSTGIVYASNEFTRDDFPIVVQIHPDGRFEAEIPMNKPEKTYVVFGDHFMFPYYMEPGQTLAMILDWEEFLTADRKRNVRYQFNQIEFRGALATINQELLAYPAEQPNYEEFRKKRGTMTPSDYKIDQKKELEKNLTVLEEYLKKNQLSAKTQKILYNGVIVTHANFLFDYAMNRDYYAQQDTTNEILKMPIPDSYYDFLQEIPLNDQSLMVVNEFSTFINRFEYCPSFRKAQMIAAKKSRPSSMQPQKTILDYFNEQKIEITNEEREFLTLANRKERSKEDTEKLQEMTEISKLFGEKYKEQIESFVALYVTPMTSLLSGNKQIETWKVKDSILIYELGLESNLAYELAKVRSLKYSYEFAGTRENASELWTFLKEGITRPYLLVTGERLLNEAYPEEKLAYTPIPDGIGADIFRKIVDPFKGKVLFVDFWATTCGPCIAGIKKMKSTREKYADNPDFEFIFITDERSSPEQNYTDFVKEQELKNIYRLSKDDYNYLRQLFKFNGIPRYVVIDAKGDVIDNNFPMHNFQSELSKLLPKYLPE
ncbi:MAG: TlpA family protein disulfide reductase [Prolixibacteraceae bacterium]